MIRLLNNLPRELWVACSGGVDSMTALDFLKNNHRVSVVFVHHGTDASNAGVSVVGKYCEQNHIPLVIKMITGNKPKELSTEEYWRDCRYDFFNELNNDWPVITAHHLDDCVETYVWSMCHGTAKVIPYRRGKILRPFLLNTKQELVSWAQRHGLEWHEDASNQDTGYTRNLVRHEVLPKLLTVNPGLSTVVKNIVQRNFDFDRYQN